jgi:hypothetical protein
MSDIPLHLQRKFEQRWAARFASPVESRAPKSTGLKGNRTLQKQKPAGDTSPQRPQRSKDSIA